MVCGTCQHNHLPMSVTIFIQFFKIASKFRYTHIVTYLLYTCPFFPHNKFNTHDGMSVSVCSIVRLAYPVVNLWTLDTWVFVHEHHIIVPQWNIWRFCYNFGVILNADLSPDNYKLFSKKLEGFNLFKILFFLNNHWNI